MKTFAFLPTQSLKKAYDGILIRYRKQDAVMDMFKIGLLLTMLCFALFVYLRYVSLSSTRGYFLRQANQHLNNISFQYEILKTQLLDQNQKNWQQVNGDESKREVITVNADIVQVPSVKELSLNK